MGFSRNVDSGWYTQVFASENKNEISRKFKLVKLNRISAIISLHIYIFTSSRCLRITIYRHCSILNETWRRPFTVGEIRTVISDRYLWDNNNKSMYKKYKIIFKNTVNWFRFQLKNISSTALLLGMRFTHVREETRIVEFRCSDHWKSNENDQRDPPNSDLCCMNWFYELRVFKRARGNLVLFKCTRLNIILYSNRRYRIYLYCQ